MPNTADFFRRFQDRGIEGLGITGRQQGARPPAGLSYDQISTFPEQQFDFRELEGRGRLPNADIIRQIVEYAQGLQGRSAYRPGEINEIAGDFESDVNKNIQALRGARGQNRRNLVAGLSRGAGRRLGSRSGAVSNIGANATAGTFAEQLRTEAGLRAGIGGLRANLRAEDARSRLGYNNAAIGGLQAAGGLRGQDYRFASGLSQQQLEFFHRLIRGVGEFEKDDDGGGGLFDTLTSIAGAIPGVGDAGKALGLFGKERKRQQ